MDVHEIKSLLITRLMLKEVYVNRDDGEHYQIIVVGDRFVNMNMLERQKIIYSVLNEYILDGCIHSVSIQVFTEFEWEKECILNLKY